MRGPESREAHSRYSGVAIFLHWAIAILIIGNFIGGRVNESLDGPMRAAVMNLHKATGLTILALTLIRLGWRLTHRPPAFPAGVSAAEARLARIGHWLFYVLMIAIPLSGWLMISASAEPRAYSWYGLFQGPFLPVQGQKLLQGVAKESHEILTWGIAILFILHVGGALRHHFGNVPGYLRRMWSGTRSTSH